MSFSEFDSAHMQRALELADRASFIADPNPAVGCVIVNDGQIVGEGFTQRPGGNHAEIEALAMAGPAAAGSDVYVTLEPCAHTGRTGPCVDALIRAQVARVCYAIEDPNPAVQGKGVARLREAGIEAVPGLLAEEAEGMNRGFVSRMRRGRPWVRCKLAASLDGRTALANGQSQWITGEAARHDVHRWRARSSAIITGIGTVLADDPKLTARPDDEHLDLVQPERVVLDSGLRTPPDAALLRGQGRVIVFVADSTAADSGFESRCEALQAAGVQIERVPGSEVAGTDTDTDRGTAIASRDAGADVGLDLAAVVAKLGELELNTVWMEAGAKLAGAMLQANCVDEFLFYFAPDLLGSAARGMFELPVMESLEQRHRLEIDDVERFGRDLRIVARPVAG